MTRVLRSAVKKNLINEDFINGLRISKKSVTIKKSANKKISSKGKESNQNDIWGINSITSNIFAFIEFKDLVNFNITCKQWNNITNPIIHKTIKLNRRWDIMKQIYGKKSESGAKINEVEECILNNAKYAHFVKDFKYNYKLNPQRAIKVFEVFRFICNLTIEGCDLSQGQFLGMISPLNQLQELILSNLRIKNSFGKGSYKEAVQLPSSLKKLRIYSVRLVGSSGLFVKTINSHSNLVDFSVYSQSNSVFLEPFYKNYPSLVKFEFYNNKLEAHQSLFDIFEHNSQLICLKLSLSSWSAELVSHINSHLINLKELELYENCKNGINYTDFYANFSQPTKIKKLILMWSRLSGCSLNSILVNCPDLEELNLNPYIHYKKPNSVKFLNFSNPVKLKKLAIDCGILCDGVFETLLLNSPNLNDISIILPCEWKGVIKSIYDNSANLLRLKILLSGQLYFQNLLDIFMKEFYETEFFTSNPKCKDTLTHLTLNGFKATDSKAKNFENFEKLKSIKYLSQSKLGFNSLSQGAGIDMTLWPDYRLQFTENFMSYDTELKRY
jgi:hypothetical protein